MQLPEGFKDYLLRTMSAEVVDELIQGLQGEPVVSIRVNRGRIAASPPNPLSKGRGGSNCVAEGAVTSEADNPAQPAPPLCKRGGGGAGASGEPGVSGKSRDSGDSEKSGESGESGKSGESGESGQLGGVPAHVPWCPEGLYLTERPVFAGDPLWHAGAYYVQEASSMFLAHVLRQIKDGKWKIEDDATGDSCTHANHKPQKYSHLQSSSLDLQSGLCLDLCAAPGGKSTLLRSLLPDDWLLISNEPVRARAQVLAENMAKWGHPNVVVTNTYAREIAKVWPTLPPRWGGKTASYNTAPYNPPVGDESFSDSNLAPHRGATGGLSLILADVPCSGEGMIRKEAEAVSQWSPRLVADCAVLQRSIVADIWPALRPGGILIYSTCTFNPDEDEENVEWIARELGADVLTIPVDPEWGILGDLRKDVKRPLPCYHFLPGRVRGEGFFCAVLQKRNDGKIPDFIENPAPKVKKSKIKKGRKEEAPMTMADWLRKHLPTLPTDQLDRPEPDRTTGKVPPIEARIELSLTDAFRYLRGESLTLPPDTPRGIVQVCFCGRRLGLMKNLGTRANNLYPKEWRIRSSHVVPGRVKMEEEDGELRVNLKLEA